MNFDLGGRRRSRESVKHARRQRSNPHETPFPTIFRQDAGLREGFAVYWLCALSLGEKPGSPFSPMEREAGTRDCRLGGSHNHRGNSKLVHLPVFDWSVRPKPNKLNQVYFLAANPARSGPIPGSVLVRAAAPTQPLFHGRQVA